MSPQTHQIFSSYLIFFSCISSSFSASLHSRPSVVFLRVAAQNEVDYWIRGAASCSEGGIYKSVSYEAAPTYMQKFCLKEMSFKGLIS